MAYTYAFPGNQTTFIPTVSTDLLIYFGKSPDKLPYNYYINLRDTDKTEGKYPRFRSDANVRDVRIADFAWAPNAKRPTLTNSNDSLTWVDYSCQRWAASREIDALGVQQGQYDVVAQAAQSAAQQLAQVRAQRIVNTLTTQGNYVNSNYAATGTVVGGGSWASGTSANPYILKSILAMQQQISLNTNSNVTPADLVLVIGPDVAIAIRQSQELIDFLKQSPVAIELWENNQPKSNRIYGLPPYLYGVQVVCEDSVKVTNEVLPPAAGTVDTRAFIWPAGHAVMMTKRQAMNSNFGAAFSSFEEIAFEQYRTEVFNDVFNRQYIISVSENVNEQFAAPESAYEVANVLA